MWCALSHAVFTTTFISPTAVFCVGSSFQCAAQSLSDIFIGRAIGGIGVGALRYAVNSCFFSLVPELYPTQHSIPLVHGRDIPSRIARLPHCTRAILYRPRRCPWFLDWLLHPVSYVSQSALYRHSPHVPTNVSPLSAWLALLAHTTCNPAHTRDHTRYRVHIPTPLTPSVGLTGPVRRGPPKPCKVASCTWLPTQRR